MRKDNELETMFRSEISLLLLKFRCPATESKYTHYKLYEQTVPMWFKWIMWSFIVLLILRRVELLILTVLDIKATARSLEVEVITVTVLFSGILLEGAAILWSKLVVIRGFPLLLASFFTIAHSSHEYYPTRPAIITIGIPIIVSCSFICNWYLYSWIFGACACAFGFVASSFYLYSNDFVICIFLFYSKKLDERVVFIIIFGWAYIAFSLASYIAEYNDRYNFFTHQKAVQEKEQWKKLLNQLPLGIVVASDGVIQFSNDECQKTFNQPQDEISVDSFGTIKDTTDEVSVKDLILDPQRLPATSEKAFIYNKPGNEKNYYMLRHSNITFWGKPSTAIILQDQSSFEKLKKLEEKYQRLYLASVVHDIRTPLNGILGMLDIINEIAGNSPEVKKYINVARGSANLLLFLTYDITDLSQIEANMIAIAEERFSPETVVEECAQLLKFNFDRKGISLKIEVAADVPKTIFSDKNRFKQILLNLLGNALKFTFKGEVKVSLKHAENQLITEVKDTGVGIKEEDMPKLFRLFGRVQENSQINPTGVGLGLTICKKLSERLGGGIKAESVFGQGSTFTFSISSGINAEGENSDVADSKFFEERFSEEEFCRPNEAHNFLKMLKNNPFYGPCPTITKESEREIVRECDCSKLLIVDDNDQNIFILESYCNMLKLGYDIARTGEEAFIKVKEKCDRKCCQQYRLILMDINMPVMDGIEATILIRRWENENGIVKVPVVALTAVDTEKNLVQKQYQEVGFNSLVGKPISKKDFKGLVSRYHIN